MTQSKCAIGIEQATEQVLSPKCLVPNNYSVRTDENRSRATIDFMRGVEGHIGGCEAKCDQPRQVLVSR